MTVDELIKELQKISEEGHGALPVLYASYYYEEIYCAKLKNEDDDEYILLDRSY